MDWNPILTAVTSLCSAALVAIFNNWDKINKSKKRVNDMYNIVNRLQASAQESAQNQDIQNAKFCDTLKTLSSAVRASLQTHILEDCKAIQSAIEDGETDYSEELKQLIILYREYYLCGYNSQGRLYFNDTIERAAEVNSVQVHELMNSYFPEYEPQERNHTHE